MPGTKQMFETNYKKTLIGKLSHVVEHPHKYDFTTNTLHRNTTLEFLNNKRSVSLLNVDYKILPGIMALRMKKGLPFVIGNTQKGS